jgi:hypothetical protein
MRPKIDITPFGDMLAPQLMYPRHLGARIGDLGTQVFLWGEGGMQGNPLGTVQPRPYPCTDAVGNINSFGAKLTPPQYGAALWNAVRPDNNRIAGNKDASTIQGLMRQPSQTVSF